MDTNTHILFFAISKGLVVIDVADGKLRKKWPKMFTHLDTWIVPPWPEARDTHLDIVRGVHLIYPGAFNIPPGYVK